MNVAESVDAQVKAVRWYHSIPLPDGTVTPGMVHNSRILANYRLPESFAGRSVLDVGAWDGFYSFEAARRGARDVLATDSFCWNGAGWGTKAGFDLARRLLGYDDLVRDLSVDPTELTPRAIGGRFDVVLFLGVLYHMVDPIGVLRRVADCCDDLLILETETGLNWLRYPAARIFPGRELNDDPSNWFQFNERALRALLSSCGFTSVETVYRYPAARRIARAVHARMNGKSFRDSFRSSRIIIHARRSDS